MRNAAFLDRTSLPRPDIDENAAAAILKAHYGLEGRIDELGSQQDRNFRIDTGDGCYVLKICRQEYSGPELEVQNGAMRHVGTKAGGPRVPQPVAALSGGDIVAISHCGQNLSVRLLDFLDGQPLTRQKYLSPATIAALGNLAGRLAMSLEDFDHPGLERDLQWDLRKASAVIAHQLEAISDPAVRALIDQTSSEALAALAPLESGLRLQPVHHDITDDNVVSRRNEDGVLIPDGVIDFGDITRGWLVAELASTCAALLHHCGGDAFRILPAVAAFHAACPLVEAEMDALWPLIVIRAAVLIASNEQQLSVEPDNHYVIGNAEHERVIFQVARSVPPALMRTAIRQALGHPLPTDWRKDGSLLIPALDPALVRIVPLDLLSEEFEAGNWLVDGIAESVLDAASLETGYAATRYGEYRFDRTLHHAPEAPETFALHVDLVLPVGTIIAAPFAGRLEWRGKSTFLAGDEMCLHLTGIDIQSISPGTVKAGDRIGVAQRLRVQLCRDPDINPPAFVRPDCADAWGYLCPSPQPLLGLDCEASPPDSAGLLARRLKVFARPQKNYYENPPQIERGLGAHLYDVTGRSFLDMVNNVTIIGHGHPRLASAVHRQWSLLNTNSRFHYKAVTEFSERLAELAPEGLDTVFLVNSGSEANDLALRLAWASSSARNMICLLEAYHGWSVASDAVSTSIADNPQALTTRPDWVHAVISPNTYRGPFRGTATTADYVATVLPVLQELDAKGERLAGFIAESVYGNAGGISLPQGYLREVYKLVRTRGGVCIADEVQVGYGRLGHHFWGFDEQGVVPDIITIAKGMGNGHPLGAVITTRAVAEAFEKEGYFFSSAGGSPVSCVVGNTVLDIMRDEKLQENARIVGDHLKARLQALGQRFDLVGAVHGMGLYLGLEFVTDRRTLTPATHETARICDRLMELGVIMQPTGDHLNVLKIKPPMCLTVESADYFADMLARVLDEGW